MNTRFLSAKLFWGVALVSAVIGAAIFQRGLSAKDYLNPLFLLFLPRLMPFGVAILSTAFGIVYFVVERGFMRRPSFPLTIAQLIFFLLAIFGLVVSAHFLGQVLSGQHATNLPMPLWGTELFLLAFSTSLVLFVMNIIRSIRRTPQNA